jgi:hypothetical protein
MGLRRGRDCSVAGKRKTAAAVEEADASLAVTDIPGDEASPANGKKASLSAAKGAKNDEFYTQWADIEK